MDLSSARSGQFCICELHTRVQREYHHASFYQRGYALVAWTLRAPCAVVRRGRCIARFLSNVQPANACRGSSRSACGEGAPLSSPSGYSCKPAYGTRDDSVRLALSQCLVLVRVRIRGYALVPRGFGLRCTCSSVARLPPGSPGPAHPPARDRTRNEQQSLVTGNPCVITPACVTLGIRRHRKTDGTAPQLSDLAVGTI